VAVFEPSNIFGGDVGRGKRGDDAVEDSGHGSGIMAWWARCIKPIGRAILFVVIRWAYR
jgi:hypothetical protein